MSHEDEDEIIQQWRHTTGRNPPMFEWLKPLRYEFDGRSVSGRGSRSRTAMVDLSEITEIGIETTDQGPFVDDVFLVINRGPDAVSIPSGTPAFNALMERLGEFPGFDWGPFLTAMGSTDCEYFLCWRKESGV